MKVTKISPDKVLPDKVLEGSITKYRESCPLQKKSGQIWTSFYARNGHFSAKWNFPYISQNHLHVSACKTKSSDNWKTCDATLERRKIGPQHIAKWTKSILGGWPSLYPYFDQESQSVTQMLLMLLYIYILVKTLRFCICISRN